MKVCDRHNDKPAVDTIHFSRDDTYVDVCDECKYAIGEVLSASVDPPKRRGRPPKELQQPN